MHQINIYLRPLLARRVGCAMLLLLIINGCNDLPKETGWQSLNTELCSYRSTIYWLTTKVHGMHISQLALMYFSVSENNTYILNNNNTHSVSHVFSMNFSWPCENGFWSFEKMFCLAYIASIFIMQWDEYILKLKYNSYLLSSV